ncbi:MAG: phosphotransferase [Rhodoferax sp.]|nr:phosphotransferase [Rhodoferax sp.]
MPSPTPFSDPANLLALVRAQFSPSAASVRHLSGERDLNFLVDFEVGKGAPSAPARCVLKVSDPKENPAALALQNAALDHLAVHAPQLPVQRLYRWNDGAHLWPLPGPDGIGYARLLGYLPGRPLHEAPSSPAQRHSVGAALGALDQALAGFAHPVVGNEALMWDIHRTPELQAWLPAIQDAQSRAWGEAVFGRYVQEVQPLLPTLAQQYLHNDFNPYNLLVDPAQPDAVCGVLDFGDMVYGPRVFDAAVAVSYQGLEGGEASVVSMRDFMRGYQRANPLQERELRLVPLLAAVRCAMTLCITEQRAQWFPENRAYILRNHAVATAGLRALMAHGLDVL